MAHESVAMEVIQGRRAKKVVPGGRPLHEYVNLYVNARNKMLFKIRDQHEKLCVLRVSPAVLDIPGTVVTDRNASSDYVRFEPAISGLQFIERDLVFAEYWTYLDDPIRQWQHGSIMCAEVLVPDRVPAASILGAYVSGAAAQAEFKNLALGLAATANAHLFFR